MRRFDEGPCPTRRAVVGSLAAAGLLVTGRPAGADEAAGQSAWATSDHARVRLVDAGPSPRSAPDRGERLAGIEVQLDAMYLTYWRSPGEAGVAPSIDFAGSANVAAVDLLFPAPGRYEEDGTEAIGYKEGVVFPLTVRPTEPGKPMRLDLAIDVAVCERQCLPVHAKLSLTLTGDGGTPEAGLVRDALARVPATRTLGEAGPLSIKAVQGTSDQKSCSVLATTRGDDVPVLFAEAPDPWFVQAGEGLWNNDGTLKFSVKILSRPSDPAPLPLRLTLVGIDGAIDVTATLDAPPHKP